jgi:dCTP deaminase
MILHDTALRARLHWRANELPGGKIELDRRSLIIDPAPDDVQIQPCSIDLRLGETLNVREGEVGNPKSSLVLLPREKGFYYKLYRGMFALAHTLETVTIPHDLVGRVEGRSTWARKGLCIEQAGWIDPGFTGQIVLELFNLSPEPVLLEYGARICQLTLHELTGIPTRMYGSEELGSKYQGQQGAEGSRDEKKR